MPNYKRLKKIMQILFYCKPTYIYYVLCNYGNYRNF